MEMPRVRRAWDLDTRAVFLLRGATQALQARGKGWARHVPLARGAGAAARCRPRGVPQPECIGRRSSPVKDR
jgi:hypothetical protein